MTLPLQGLTFLELGEGAPTAYAGRLLANLGATVVATSLVGGTTGRCDPTADAGKHLLAPQHLDALRTLPVAGAIDATGQLSDARYPVVRAVSEDATAAWAGSGGMWLTGHADGPPLAAPADVAGRLRGAAACLELLTGLGGTAVAVDGARLLGERAALGGLTRHGTTTAGGACRLVRTADGWLAVNLPREEDWSLILPWLEVGAADWTSIAAAVRHRPAHATAERAQMLGLPVAPLAQPADAAADPQAGARGQRFPFLPISFAGRAPTLQAAVMLEHPGEVPASGAVSASGAVGTGRPRTIVDLSSLWAGPLATSLLAAAGARVIKVEGAGRPDGARDGAPALFQLLNAGKESVVLDLRTEDGRTGLAALLRAADVVVEASRPRALDNLGLGPSELLGLDRPQVWLTLTGQGRSGPRRQWAALGDDAAVAGGLVAIDGDGSPVFCGDAIADPATGLHGAVGGAACLLTGGTQHIDIALREVAGALLGSAPRLPPCAAARQGARGWEVDTAHGPVAVARPTARRPSGPAPASGADSERVLAEVGARR
jgi:crotonobetainyl-CoA:carnitine CoA-transferase CaiB-like acyl-CoA transferase